MQEVLTELLHLLTADTIPDVVRALCSHLQNGVGLATRVSAVESISLLVEQYPLDLGPHATVAFKSIVHSLVRAPSMAQSLQKAMLTGLGALSKVVDSDLLTEEVGSLVDMYTSLGKDHVVHDSAVSVVLARCIKVLLNKAGDRVALEDAFSHTTKVQPVWPRVLSCIYIGTFDFEEETRSVWSEAWSDALSSSGAGSKSIALLRTLPLVMAGIEGLIKDRSWNRRTQGVTALADVVAIVDVKALSVWVPQVLLPLLHSIPGQIWRGQGGALETLAKVITKCKDHFHVSTNSDVVFSSRTYEGGEVILRLEDLVRKRERACPGVTDETEEMPRKTVVVGEGGDGGEGEDGDDQLVAVVDGTSSTSTSLATPLSTTTTVFSSSSSSSTTNSSSSSSTTTTTTNNNTSSLSWEVGILPYCLLLIHEANRGERDYRLSAALAVSLLPWHHISSVGSAAFVSLIPRIRIQGDIFVPVSPTVNEVDTSVSLSLSLSLSHSLLDQSSAQSSAVRNGRSGTRRDQYNMFGSRYGVSATTGKAGVKSATSTTATATATATAVAITDSTTFEPSAMVVVEEFTAMVTPVTETYSETHSDAIASSSSSNSDSTSNSDSDSSSTTSSSEAFVPSLTTLATPATATATSILPVPVQGVKDPAYRMMFVDCLHAGWPQSDSQSLSTQEVAPEGTGSNPTGRTAESESSNSISNSSSNSSDGNNSNTWRAELASHVPGLLDWALHAVTSDVWSIRKSAIQLMGSIGASSELEFTSIERVLLVLSKGTEEQKYVKIRVEALRSLHRCISGPNGRALSDSTGGLTETVRTIIRSASIDKQPTILEAVSKVQDAWLRLQLQWGASRGGGKV